MTIICAKLIVTLLIVADTFCSSMIVVCHNNLSLLAKTANLQVYNITRDQIARWLLAHANAGWGSRCNDIAGM